MKTKDEMTDERLRFLESDVLATDNAQELFQYLLEQQIDSAGILIDDPNGIRMLNTMAICKFIRDYLIRPADQLRKGVNNG